MMPAAAVLEERARHCLPTSPPASDDLARRGAAPVRALFNNNPALSWDMAPDHRLTIAGSSPTGIVALVLIQSLGRFVEMSGKIIYLPH